MFGKSCWNRCATVATSVAAASNETPGLSSPNTCRPEKARRLATMLRSAAERNGHAEVGM